MKTAVLYDATCETSEHVARAVASSLRAFGPVRLVPAPYRVQWDALLEAELIVVGAPTHGQLESTHHLQHLIERLPDGSLRGKLAAAFDTWRPSEKSMMGSAASGLTRRLRAKGAHVVSPPTSFMASEGESILTGELERAAAWASRFSGKAVRTRPLQP